VGLPVSALRRRSGRGVRELASRRGTPRRRSRREAEVVTGVVLDRSERRDGQPLIGWARLAGEEIGADEDLRTGEAAVGLEHLMLDAGHVRARDDVTEGRPTQG